MHETISIENVHELEGFIKYEGKVEESIEIGHSYVICDNHGQKVPLQVGLLYEQKSLMKDFIIIKMIWVQPFIQIIL